MTISSVPAFTRLIMALAWMAALASLTAHGQSISGVEPLRLDPGTACVDPGLTAETAETTPPRPDPENLLETMESLDRRIETASDTELPALLLERGRARTDFRVGARSPYASYASSRPEEFRYNEIGADWLYQGNDFRELTRLFPDSDLVDDAAYALTLLPRGGECEGWIPCYIAWQWNPIAEFLRAYPNSPLVEPAVQRALASFSRLDPEADFRVPTWEHGPDELRDMVASLDEIGRVLPPPHRTRLLERAGQLWTQYAEYDRARYAYETALFGAEPAARACLEARLDTLPAGSFTLEPARVIHPRHVELTWQRPLVEPGGFVIYRSNTRSDMGTAAARLPADTLTWADTQTEAGSTYWYRVIAETADSAVQSNPASAETPTLQLNIHGIAVSTPDHRLHVFGSLSNGFPQVIRISVDGAVERIDGSFLGIRTLGAPVRAYDDYVDGVWLPDGTGRGVLRFSGSPGAPSAELFSAVRRGAELLRAEVNQSRRITLLVSVDESETTAWIAQGGGGRSVPIAMDCLAAGTACWFGGEEEVQLRDASDRVLATVPLQPDDGSYSSRFWATAVHADPQDGSAWVLLGQAGRLLHVDRTGTIRHDLRLTPETESYSLVMTADFDRRSIWFTRLGEGRRMELVRIDLNDQGLRQSVVTTDVPRLANLVPDMNGGVWLVTRDQALRIDDSGRAILSVALNE